MDATAARNFVGRGARNPAWRGKGGANADRQRQTRKEPSTAWDPLLPDDGGIAPHNPAPQHKAVALGVLVYLRCCGPAARDSAQCLAKDRQFLIRCRPSLRWGGRRRGLGGGLGTGHKR